MSDSKRPAYIYTCMLYCGYQDTGQMVADKLILHTQVLAGETQRRQPGADDAAQLTNTMTTAS